MKYATDKSLGAAPPAGEGYICHLPHGLGGYWGRGRTRAEAVKNAKRAARNGGAKLKNCGAFVVTNEKTGEDASG